MSVSLAVCVPRSCGTRVCSAKRVLREALSKEVRQRSAERWRSRGDGVDFSPLWLCAVLHVPQRSTALPSGDLLPYTSRPRNGNSLLSRWQTISAWGTQKQQPFFSLSWRLRVQGQGNRRSSGGGSVSHNDIRVFPHCGRAEIAWQLLQASFIRAFMRALP